MKCSMWCPVIQCLWRLQQVLAGESGNNARDYCFKYILMLLEFSDVFWMSCSPHQTLNSTQRSISYSCALTKLPLVDFVWTVPWGDDVAGDMMAFVRWSKRSHLRWNPLVSWYWLIPSVKHHWLWTIINHSRYQHFFWLNKTWVILTLWSQLILRIPVLEVIP